MPGVAVDCRQRSPMRAGGCRPRRSRPIAFRRNWLPHSRAMANHSVTVAPEAGSERMRKVINKNLTEDEILDAAEMMVGEGVEKPQALLYDWFARRARRRCARNRAPDRARSSSARARRKNRVGHVTVSLNPFVPKPWTPFQWDPMEDAARLKRKIAMLRAALAEAAAPHRTRRGIAPRGLFPDPGVARRSTRRRNPRTPRASADAKMPARSGMSSRAIRREGARALRTSRIPTFRDAPLPARRDCCRGTLSIITFTNGFCFLNARRRITSIRPGRAMSRDARSAARAENIGGDLGDGDPERIDLDGVGGGLRDCAHHSRLCPDRCRVSAHRDRRFHGPRRWHGRKHRWRLDWRAGPAAAVRPRPPRFPTAARPTKTSPRQPGPLIRSNITASGIAPASRWTPARSSRRRAI